MKRNDAPQMMPGRIRSAESRSSSDFDRGMASTMTRIRDAHK